MGNALDKLGAGENYRYPQLLNNYRIYYYVNAAY